jgi:SAM-dependent methyltransferase
MKNISNLTNEINSVKDDKKAHQIETSQISNRDYYIKIGNADKLLEEIGILGQNGKIKNDKIRKYNQIDHFIEILSPILENMCKQKDCINIVDCGCGKSYLSFVLNYYIKEVLKKSCNFFGIDTTQNVINQSKKMAKNLGYKNMEFINCDIKNYMPNMKIDMVISLHACDTATDEALAFGIKNKVSSMIIVPCCHKEFLNQYKYDPFKEILKHGVFKARMADVLTDGMRAILLEAYGYKVSTVEYVSPVETPKNLMILAVLNKKFDPKLMNKYDSLSSVFGVDLSLKNLILY